MRRGVVLHVAEAYGGGVMNVIHDYVDAAPDLEHHVLARKRPGHDTGSLPASGGPHRRLPLNPVKALAAIHRTVRDLEPEVVHAHSSIAGALVRLLPTVPRSRIVYTPHCYAFEREDLGWVVRRLYLLVEWLLAPRTGYVVAVSPRELALARRLRRGQRGRYVPNIVRLEAPPSPAGAPADTGPPTVAAVGRVSAQKDPAFFAEVVEAAAAQGLTHVHWLWLGEGDAAPTERLRDLGVDVSGWLPRETVLERLGAAAVYLHTASWEGSPLSVLEAAELGVPVVVRRTPATESLDSPNLVCTPADAARRVGEVLALSRAEALAPNDAFLARHTVAAQEDGLRRAYAEVVGGVLSGDACA